MSTIKRKKMYNFSVIIEQDENGMYIGTVPGLRSCYTQAKTLAELYKRLEEVIALCLKAEKDLFGRRPAQNEFVGVQRLQFSL